jgi:hypothetical protein
MFSFNLQDRVRKNGANWLAVSGIILVIFAIGLFFFYESIGKDKLFYTDIYVLNDEVHRGVEITAEMIEIVRIEKNSVIKNVVLNIEEIIGKEASQFIPKGIQLDKRFFENPGLVLNDNEKITKIPKEWWVSVPNTLRRKDVIEIYAVPANKLDFKAVANIQTSTSKSQSTTNDGTDVTTETTTGEVTISTHSEEDADYLKEEIKDSKPIMIVTVAYVKDSANREVTTISKQDRIEGSSTIADVEIVVDPDAYLQKIVGAIEEGNKLIAMYTEGGVMSEVGTIGK